MNVGEFLTPKLWELSTRLREVLPRVQAMSDEEAVHDMRVLIRRLRSLLKPARRVYGEFHTDVVRQTLKAVADATGELRDEEVLEQTLASVELPPTAEPALQAFLRVRKKRLEALQAELVSVVEGGEAARAIGQLEALITLPIEPKRERAIESFARSVVKKAFTAVERGQVSVGLDDTKGLHELRILFKRLRYAVDGFHDVLPQELREQSGRAARFQKRLGEVHDVDVALATVRGAAELSPQTQALLIVGLERLRAKAIGRYAEERAKPADEGLDPSSQSAVSAPDAAAPSKPKKRRGKHKPGQRAKSGVSGQRLDDETPAKKAKDS